MRVSPGTASPSSTPVRAPSPAPQADSHSHHSPQKQEASGGHADDDDGDEDEEARQRELQRIHEELQKADDRCILRARMRAVRMHAPASQHGGCQGAGLTAWCAAQGTPQHRVHRPCRCRQVHDRRPDPVPHSARLIWLHMVPCCNAQRTEPCTCLGCMRGDCAQRHRALHLPELQAG
jgi:hypothetical protein